MSSEDALLVRQCLRGEPAAIQTLVERFQAEVFGLCVRLMRHRHDAEDVTQEVFLRIFRSLRRWDPDRPLRPWIMSIAVNRCRTWLSQRGASAGPAGLSARHRRRARTGRQRGTAAEIQAAWHELRPSTARSSSCITNRGNPTRRSPWS